MPMFARINTALESFPDNTYVHALAGYAAKNVFESSSRRFIIVILHDQNQLGGDDLSGKVKLKVDPLPTSLSTQILPPCSSTNFLAKVNPSPVPSILCVESEPTCRN